MLSATTGLPLLVFLTLIVIFLIISVFMISRTLKDTKGNLNLLAQQNQQLKHTLEEVERTNKNYLRIMRVMAHDLRNPLSGITGLASMLMVEDEFSEDSKTMLKLIETTGLHSMEMINELLKSSLADEDERLIKQHLDLRALLFDSVELLQYRAKEKKQQLVFETSDEPIMADINHEKIWRVVNNLIVNAIKFSYTGDTIKVDIKETNGHILISVADNGVGIPAGQKEVIFEMFTPAKKTGTNGEQPFGLGLSISKRIIELHGGKIWFEPNTPNGTIFYIELPAAE